jgi:hypothetical protein
MRGGWIMKVRNARHRRSRIGLGRGGKLLALATAALLDQGSAKRRRTRGNEAPMVIGPRGVARLLRDLLTTIRGTKK